MRSEDTSDQTSTDTSDSSSQSDTSEASSTKSSERVTYSRSNRHGVVPRTHARRAQVIGMIRPLIVAKTITTSQLETVFHQQDLSPTTTLTKLTTAIAELKRLNITIIGDVKGLIKAFTTEATAHHRNRDPPATPSQVHTILNSQVSITTKQIITLLWATTCRLTSILGLQNRDIVVKGYPERDPMTQRVTPITVQIFRGKTLNATGPFTVRTVIPTTIALTIITLQTQHSPEAVLFPGTTDSYYKRLRPTLAHHNLTVRSFRRGAIQTLTQYPPDQIRLFSRHTSNKSLYNYLDDGLLATWEHTHMETMANQLW